MSEISLAELSKLRKATAAEDTAITAQTYGIYRHNS